MATARAKPATEPETEPETTATDSTEKGGDDLRSTIREVLSEMLPKGEAKTEPKGDGDKPMTAREEEARTLNIVQEAIKAFKDEIVEKPESKSEKKEAETIPGSAPVRWIEKVLWGKE